MKWWSWGKGFFGLLYLAFCGNVFSWKELFKIMAPPWQQLCLPFPTHIHTTQGPQQPVRTILKRDQAGLGYGPTPRPKVTHFQAKDPQAVERPAKLKERRERGTTVSTKAQRRKETRQRDWERDFRSSFHVDLWLCLRVHSYVCAQTGKLHQQIKRVFYRLNWWMSQQLKSFNGMNTRITEENWC